MTAVALEKPRYAIKSPENLSLVSNGCAIIISRAWTGHGIMNIPPGPPALRGTFSTTNSRFILSLRPMLFCKHSDLHSIRSPGQWHFHTDFWNWTLPERRAWFNREVMVHYLPQEILPGDLIAGARFNVQTSACLTKKETRERDRQVYGSKGIRAAMLWFHNHGYGNAGATSGHLIPDYGRILRGGWKAIHAEIEEALAALPESERRGKKGGQLRAMLIAATMPRDLAAEYSKECIRQAQSEGDSGRRAELQQMAEILTRDPMGTSTEFLGGSPVLVDHAHVNHGGRKLPRSRCFIWSS